MTLQGYKTYLGAVGLLIVAAALMYAGQYDQAFGALAAAFSMMGLGAKGNRILAAQAELRAVLEKIQKPS